MRRLTIGGQKIGTRNEDDFCDGYDKDVIIMIIIVIMIVVMIMMMILLFGGNMAGKNLLL